MWLVVAGSVTKCLLSLDMMSRLIIKTTKKHARNTKSPTTSKILSFYRAFAVDLTFLWFWSHFAKAVCASVILHCKFDLRGARVLQEVWLTNCGLILPRVLVCQHDEVTKPISTVVVSRIKRTRSSSIVSLHWAHEELPGVARRAAIVWLENWNERSTFALEFRGGFVAMGTF